MKNLAYLCWSIIKVEWAIKFILDNVRSCLTDSLRKWKVKVHLFYEEKQYVKYRVNLSPLNGTNGTKGW